MGTCRWVSYAEWCQGSFEDDDPFVSKRLDFGQFMQGSDPVCLWFHKFNQTCFWVDWSSWPRCGCIPQIWITEVAFFVVVLPKWHCGLNPVVILKGVEGLAVGLLQLEIIIVIVIVVIIIIIIIIIQLDSPPQCLCWNLSRGSEGIFSERPVDDVSLERFWIFMWWKWVN